MATENLMTPSEYIQSHFVHLTNRPQEAIIDFRVVNIDSVVISFLLGSLLCLVLWSVARKATFAAPSRFQGFFEMLAEMVESQAKAVIHNAESRKLVVPMALMVLCWVFLLSFMDLVPVDLLPQIWKSIIAPATGWPANFKAVPPTDLSTTLGLAVSVLLLCLYYNAKIKGPVGWAKELVSAPFGTSKNPFFAVLLGVVNFTMQIIEYIAKTVSHAMRLFGNLFAGELVFMLIALLGGFAALSLGGGMMVIGQLIAGTAWAIFHILVITLQAFIFMMLALIYLGQAHHAH